MVRLGLMGCGVVASYGHVPAIGRTAGCKLVSIFEPDSARLIDANPELAPAPEAIDVSTLLGD